MQVMQPIDQHSSSLADLAPGIMLELVKHMRSVDKRSWRLVNRAACQAVYEGTTALSARAAAFRMSDTQLPLPLLSRCSSLKRLSCRRLLSLSSIHGLPPALELLNISETRVEDLSPLEQCTGLRHLSLRTFPLDAKDAIQQLTHVVPLTALQRLDLSYYLPGSVSCAEGTEGAEAAQGARALALILKQLTGLHHLELRVGYLGREGAKALASALAPALQQLTGLRHLDVHGMVNGLGVEGARALVPVIQQLTRLEHLGVGSNHLGDEGASALAPAIQQLTGLRYLDMSHNDLGDEGAYALAPAIKALSELRHLELEGNDIGEAAEEALGCAMHERATVHILDYNCFNISDLGC